jgi:TolB-like protein
MKNKYIRKIPFFGLCFVFCAGAALFSGCATGPAAGDANVSLDRAIQIAVENIEQGMGDRDTAAYAGSAAREMEDGDMDLDAVRRRAQEFTKKPVVAVLSVNSLSGDLSAYILEELSLALAGSSRFTVVDRQRLDLIRREEKFQLSGEVSDETAQAIGKKLGAQYVVTGALLEMGNYYRFRVMVLNVETAAVNAPTSINVDHNDDQIRFFLAGAKTAQAEQEAKATADAKAEEEKQEAEEKERRSAEAKAKWEAVKDSARLRMIQAVAIGFQFDKGFSYVFGETGIRWSFLPFTSIGADFAIGANMTEPEIGMVPVFYGYAAMCAGLVMPLVKSENVRLHLFGDGLVQCGSVVYPGLLADPLTPGFDAGVNLSMPDTDGPDIGINIKYKGLWYKGNEYTNSITAGLTFLL